MLFDGDFHQLFKQLGIKKVRIFNEKSNVLMWIIYLIKH